LLDVKRIYVDSRGYESLSQNIRDSLISSLQLSKRFEVARNPEEADAALKLIVNRERSGGMTTRGETQRNNISQVIERASVGVALVNADDTIIWPGERARSYSGFPSEVSAKIIKDLLDDREKLERGQ
jgi:hypothetical protein